MAPSDSSTSTFESLESSSRAEIDLQLAAISQVDCDVLPYAALETDAQGRVLLINGKARQLLGLQGSAVGRAFFTDICAWANNPLFLGRFVAGVRRAKMDETFSFVLKVGAQLVLTTVRLFLEPSSQRYWILFS